MTDDPAGDDVPEGGQEDAAQPRAAGIRSVRRENSERLDEFPKRKHPHTRLKWRIRRAFGATNTRRVKLLNEVSGSTAPILQDALDNEVISRLYQLGEDRDKMPQQF